MKIKLFFLVSILFLISSCHSTKNIGNVTRDGSSYEKAIIVNSISEEYDYVRNTCENCEFEMQSLNFEKKKPYDILEFKKTNGETIQYYFDISKFFGKY